MYPGWLNGCALASTMSGWCHEGEPRGENPAPVPSTVGFPLPGPHLHEALPFEFAFSSEAVYLGAGRDKKQLLSYRLRQPPAGFTRGQPACGLVVPKQSLAPSLPFAWFSEG